MRKIMIHRMTVLAILWGGVGLTAVSAADSGTPGRTSEFAAEPEGSAAVLLTQQNPARKLVSGYVTDATTGEPLIGCSVLIKGSTEGTLTNLDGYYEFTVAEGTTLEISYIGYVTRTVTVGKISSINIELSPDAEQLSGAVLTAFGSSQRKETVTGSVQSIAPADLKVPVSNLSNAFAGRLSGVVAYQRSGEPGANGSNFYIRGISTLSGVTSPLIVMDGVEISSADLNAIDPDIIESFSILKDATATAMYGTRGANGVMIIKTKSGSNLDRAKMSVRFENYVNTPTTIASFVDGPTYMRMYNEAEHNQGTGAKLFTADQIRGTELGLDPYIYPNVDWYNEIFKNITNNQKANFNIRGGSSRITYFMNINVNHETGMLKDNASKYYSYKNNIDLKKYAFQNNIDFNMSESSKISLHLNVQLNDYTGPTNDVNSIFNRIMNDNPVDFPMTLPNTGDGDWVHWGILGGGNQQGAGNPMAMATAGFKNYFESTVIANIDFDQRLDFITEGLSFRALYSFKNWSYTQVDRYQNSTNYYELTGFSQNPDGSYEYEITPWGTPSKPTLTTATSTTGDRRQYIQAYFNYDRSFNDHQLSGMLLFNTDEYNTNSPDGLIASLPKRKMGLAARMAYDYKHKYMIEFNAGYNGSENFAKGHRWGFFPSVSAGWNVSQEKFWEPLRDVVSNLKVRGSYGLVGNDQIGGARYIYLAQVTLQNSNYGYTTGYGSNRRTLYGPSYDRYQNDDITWEVGRKLNVGIDLSLFNKLSLTLEGFQEIRSNIFQQKNSIPNYMGTAGTTIYGNFAKVKNWGFEASADYNHQIDKDWYVGFKGTFTFARNKILEYDEGAGTRPNLSMIGKKLNSIWGYVADGLYIDQADIDNNPTSTIGNIAIAPGDIKYLDQPDANGEYDGRITSDDRVVLGHPTVPEIIYGFGPTVQYRNWDFSFFFQGAANVSLMMSGFHPFGTQYNRNVLSWIAEDYWSPTNANPNAGYPRLSKMNNNHNEAASSFWLRDAAFLKLKNLELGYNFKIIRVYFSAQNLFTISPFKLWDPEMGGGAGLTYPTQRTFSLGLQVNF